MRDKDLYQQIFGLTLPWRVTSVVVDMKDGDVTVQVAAKSGSQHRCPKCGTPCPGYDHRRRQSGRPGF